MPSAAALEASVPVCPTPTAIAADSADVATPAQPAEAGSAQPMTGLGSSPPCPSQGSLLASMSPEGASPPAWPAACGSTLSAQPGRQQHGFWATSSSTQV